MLKEEGLIRLPQALQFRAICGKGCCVRIEMNVLERHIVTVDGDFARMTANEFGKLDISQGPERALVIGEFDYFKPGSRSAQHRNEPEDQFLPVRGNARVICFGRGPIQQILTPFEPSKSKHPNT